MRRAFGYSTAKPFSSLEIRPAIKERLVPSVVWSEHLVREPIRPSLLFVIMIGLSPAMASSIGTISQSALSSSTALYTDQIGGGIGSIVVMTGPVGDPNVGNASGQSDDGFSGPVNLGFPFSFFGQTYTSLFINTNGNITYDTGLVEFTPLGPQSTSEPFIAPFFADVDTTGPGSGVVYLRTDIPNEVIVTWAGVGYFAQNTDKLDTFQVVLRGPGYNVPTGEGQIGFFYGSMQWEVGDSSGGVDGFCPQGLTAPDCIPAAIGFGDGNSNGVLLTGSMMNGISTIVNNERIWFRLDANGIPVAVGPGPTCSFTVIPGGLSLASDGGFSSISVSASSPSCSWTATGPGWISLSPSSGMGSGTVSVSAGANTSAQPLTGTISVAGQNISATQPPQATVSLTNLTATYDGTPKSVAVTITPPGLSYSVAYTHNGNPVIAPTNAGSYGVSVTITAAGYPGSATGTLTIMQATPPVNWANPVAMTYGTALGATQLNATASIPGTFTYSPASGTVLAVGQQSLAVTFTPTDATDYTTVTKTVQITVNQATATVALSNLTTTYNGSAKAVTVTTIPAGLRYSATYTLNGKPVTAPTHAGSYGVSVTITAAGYPGSATGTLTIMQATPPVNWANPAAMTYGTALGATQLNATASIPGKFTYSPASGTVLAVGQQSLAVTFTPTDATDYTTVTKTVQITVNQKTPALTLSNLAAIYDGTPKSVTVTTTPPGLSYSVAYTLNGNPVIAPTHAGSYGVSVTITTAGYPFSTTGTLTILKATPKVNWANPAAIAYGTALGAAQLNATASIPGTFNYSPPSGTVLAVGRQTLAVAFMPIDLIDYTSITTTVYITVIQGRARR